MKPFYVLILIALVVVMLSPAAQARLVERTINYQVDGANMKGYLVYDDTWRETRPGVLVVHEFWGLNEYPKSRARELADMGYVAFAVDMYGNGRIASDRNQASQWAGEVRNNRPLMRRRAQAGLEQLLAVNLVDRKRVAAIGFCFGGTVALELAYSGAPLAGVATFHAGLTEPAVEDMRNIKAKILVMTGAEDPAVPPSKLQTFGQSMVTANTDWQMIIYSDAVHAFTNPEAGNNPSTGAAYNEKAARRSWRHMQVFFEEIFK